MKHKNSRTLVFQDVMEGYLSGRRNEQGDDAEHHDDVVVDDGENGSDDPVSLAFFELANAPEIAYRVLSKKKMKKQINNNKKRKRKLQGEIAEESLLRFHQDTAACLHHTGGIVWETSVLLLQYLLHQFQQQEKSDFPSLGSVIEVGAGCGLLGQGLAASLSSEQCRTIVQTETAQVLVNLQSNLQQNRSIIDSNNNNCIAEDDLSSSAKQSRIQAYALDWTSYKQDAQSAQLAAHSFDTVLGTDVIFNPNLVEPLLQTLAFLCRKPNGVVYICVQERCAASHAQFIRQAPDYGFEVQELTSDLNDIPSCQWGLAVECHLYRLSQRSNKKV